MNPRRPAYPSTDPCMTKTTPATAEFEPEFIAGLKAIFEEKIVFNQVLGLKITSLQTRARHRAHRHEAASSWVTTATTACTAASSAPGSTPWVALACHGRHRRAPHGRIAREQRLHRFGKLGTIDLRIDYLRPGIGEFFELRAEVMRLGSRVASTRMEFLGPDGKLLSCGSGAYIVS